MKQELTSAEAFAKTARESHGWPEASISTADCCEVERSAWLAWDRAWAAATQPKDAEIAALKAKLAAKDVEVAFLHSVRRDERAMCLSYTRPDTQSTFLLRRALKQLDRWAEKYGQWQPEWLPPGGDVTLVEDIDAHIAQAVQSS